MSGTAGPTVHVTFAHGVHGPTGGRPLQLDAHDRRGKGPPEVDKASGVRGTNTYVTPGSSARTCKVNEREERPRAYEETLSAE